MTDVVVGYLPHIVTEGQRWDSLAWQYYGDAYAYERLVAANPGIPLAPILPTGVTVLVPIVQAPEVLTNSEDLPPWKR